MKQALVVSGSLGGKLAELFEIEGTAAAEVEGGDLLAQRLVEGGVRHGEIVGGIVLADETNKCGDICPAFFLEGDTQPAGPREQVPRGDFLVSGKG